MSTRDAYVTRWEDVVPLPSGIGQQARGVARSMALTILGAIALPPADRFLRPIYFHHVFDDQREKFEQLVVWLKEIGTFVDTGTCLEMLEGSREIDARYFHLSFDDGFRNVTTNALPILRKHAVPAIIFVPTSLVSADWGAAREYCLETRVCESVIEMVRWEDLREAVAAGFEVGSHTKTHVRLADVSWNAALLEDEIRGSKRQIEESLGTECRYISWPYGRLSDLDGRSRELAEESGYRACFGAFRGSITPRRTSRYAVPRHQLEVQWPMSHLRFFAGGGLETRATRRQPQLPDESSARDML